MRWHLRHVAKVLAVSANSQAALKALGVPGGRVRLLYNNADTDALGKARPLAAGQRKALGVPVGRPLLVAAGMRRPHKGFDILLQGLARYYSGAAAKLPASKRPFTVLLGDVANAEKGHEALLQRLAEHPALRGNFAMLAAQRPFAPWLKSAALFVSSSRWEGSPLVVLEAMAAGCCVLATHEGAGEVVAQGRTGRLVPSEDAEALALGLQALMESPALRKRLGAAASKDVRRRFSLKAYVRDLAAVYDGMLEAGHGI
jgi:mannosyltransferase